MLTLPDSEQRRFDDVLQGRARQFGLAPDEYLRKIWYHENAAQLGEYVAMVLVDDLVRLAPSMRASIVELNTDAKRG